jgi:hypothetical protein
MDGWMGTVRPTQRQGSSLPRVNIMATKNMCHLASLSSLMMMVAGRKKGKLQYYNRFQSPHLYDTYGVERALSLFMLYIYEYIY